MLLRPQASPLLLRPSALPLLALASASLLCSACCGGEPAGQPKGAAASAASGPVAKGPPKSAQASAQLLAAGNMDGLPGDEVVAVWQNEIAVYHLSESGELTPAGEKAPGEPVVAGGPQVLLVRDVDVDGDGRAEALIGFGQTRAERSPPETLAMLSLPQGKGPRELRVLYQVRSDRADVSSIAVGDLDGDRRNEIVFARFDSQYHVAPVALSLPAGSTLAQGVWQPRPLPRIRMAMYWAAADLDGDGKAELVAGRPYGEEKLGPGDLGVLPGQASPEGGEARAMIPTQGGVRSVAVGDVDGDGKPEVLFGDGWDSDYGKKARARLNVARRGPQGYSVELVDESPGQFEIKQIEAVDLDGDGAPELVAAGNTRVTAYRRRGGAYVGEPLADGDGFAVARSGTSTFVLVAGNPIKVVPVSGGR